MKRFDSIEIELFLFSQFLILISSTSLAIFRQRKFKDSQKEERFGEIIEYVARGCEGALITPQNPKFHVSICSLTVFTLRDATGYQHLSVRRRTALLFLIYIARELLFVPLWADERG